MKIICYDDFITIFAKSGDFALMAYALYVIYLNRSSRSFQSDHLLRKVFIVSNNLTIYNYVALKTLTHYPFLLCLSRHLMLSLISSVLGGCLPVCYRLIDALLKD